MSTEIKFKAVAQLIREKHYGEARALLKTMSHPKADEWLAKLDKIAPTQPVSKPKNQEVKKQETKKRERVTFGQFLRGVAIFFIFMFMCAIVLFMPTTSRNNPQHPPATSAPKDTAQAIVDDLSIVAGGRNVDRVYTTVTEQGEILVTVLYLTTETTEPGFVEEWLDLFDGVAYSIKTHNLDVDGVMLAGVTATGEAGGLLLADANDVIAYYEGRISRLDFLSRIESVPL